MGKRKRNSISETFFHVTGGIFFLLLLILIIAFIFLMITFGEDLMSFFQEIGNLEIPEFPEMSIEI